MTRLYAQPYDISTRGFYFETAEEYNGKVSKVRNSFGGPVEEFEIQFVEDGLFGEISESIRNYLDYDSIACDLGMDYAEIGIDGMRYIYRCY